MEDYIKALIKSYIEDYIQEWNSKSIKSMH